MNKTICNNEELQAHALSHVPPHALERPPDKHNVHALQKLVQWYRDWLPIDSDLQETFPQSVSSKIKCGRRLKSSAVDQFVFVVSIVQFCCILPSNMQRPFAGFHFEKENAPGESRFRYRIELREFVACAS